MNSLTTKRFVQYQQRLSNPHHEDDIEPKLDTLITASNLTNTKLESIAVNTDSTTFHGVLNFSLPILATQYSSIIDLGVSSKLLTFYWTGDQDSPSVNYQILVSSDNITYYPFTKAVFTQTATKVETHYQMAFRYHKLEVFNNNASTAATLSFHYAARI